MVSIPPILGEMGVGSSESPEGPKLQRILDEHFPTELGPHIGCNLVIMREEEPPYLLTGGTIPSDAPQHWGSVSKQFTAACILELVSNQYLNFDDDIRTICPDLPEFTYEGVAQTITVDQLLYMQSGLKWLAKTGHKIGKNKLSFAPINKKIEGKKWRTKNAAQNSRLRWP